MTDLAPLILLWALSSSRDRTRDRDPFERLLPPAWPDTRSPPPPLPAFEPHVPTPPKPGPQHGTPLEALAKGAQKVKKTADVLDKARDAALKAAPTAARHAARQAFGRIRKGVSLRDPFASLMPSSRGEVLVSKSVADVQAIVNARGGALKRDGLWGPKTKAAWANLARAQGLPATIERGGPRVARVAATAWEVLSVPVIP